MEKDKAKELYEAGKMISLAAYTGNNKHAGLLIKKTSKGMTYYMKYRDENNKVVKKAITGIQNLKQSKALEIFDDVKRNIKKIKEGKPPEKKRKNDKLKTLNEMAYYYFENKKFKSVEKEKSRYNYYFREKELATKLFNLVEIEELLDYQDELQKMVPDHIIRTERAGKVSSYPNKTLSNKTINNTMALASAIVEFALYKRKYFGINPFRFVDKLEVDNVKMKRMKKHEIETYLELLKKYDDDRDQYRIGYLYGLLALTTGARVQTLLSIEIENIDFEEREINIYNHKSEKEYICHIVSDTVADTIKEIIIKNGYPDRQYLFCPKDSQERYKNYPKYVKTILDRHINSARKISDKLTIRDLRNVFATRLINKGMNLSYIQNLLNHTSPTMTSRYARMLDKTGGDELKDMFGDVKL